jgi:hypothetical protein
MGGPTGIFGGLFNIYAAAASVDNMNYASKTLWGGVAERYVVGGAHCPPTSAMYSHIVSLFCR